MIGSGGNISAYASHNHEHAVTRCLHETHGTSLENAGGMAQTQQMADTQVYGQEQDARSLANQLLEGCKSLFSKTTGFLGKVWNGTEDLAQDAAGAVRPGDADIRQTAQTATVNAGNPQAVQTAVNAGDPQVMQAAAVTAGIPHAAVAEAAGTAHVRAEKSRESLQEEREQRIGQTVGNVESAVSGSLKREPEGVRKFFEKVSTGVARVERFWKDEEIQELAPKEEDFFMSDGSYLLDSYNKSGEYATLAKDRSLEGSFRAKG